MRCSICGNEPLEELVHLPIYVSGWSEGVDLCFACKMVLTTLLQQMRSMCARTRIALVRETRIIEKEIAKIEERRKKDE